MSEFHAIIHATDGDNAICTDKFGSSFEDVSDAFRELPRMFLEPDGSFVWVIEEDGQRYQLDGLLTDDGASLIHCELKGRCGQQILDELLSALGWPEQMVRFQLVQEGTYLTEAEFRKNFIDTP